MTRGRNTRTSLPIWADVHPRIIRLTVSTTTGITSRLIADGQRALNSKETSESMPKARRGSGRCVALGRYKLMHAPPDMRLNRLGLLNSVRAARVAPSDPNPLAIVATHLVQIRLRLLVAPNPSLRSCGRFPTPRAFVTRLPQMARRDLSLVARSAEHQGCGLGISNTVPVGSSAGPFVSHLMVRRRSPSA